MAMSAGDANELRMLMELQRCLWYQRENLRNAREISGKIRGFRAKPFMGRLERMEIQVASMEVSVSERIQAMSDPGVVIE